MALSIVSIPGDGVTDTFNVSFALGILDRTSTTAWVTGEVDGGGNKIYRTITYLTDTMLKISGAKAGVGVNVVFTRTVSQTNLIVNYEDGDIMNETNLNVAQKQALMLVHQVLDGRFSAFIQDVSAGGFRITNLGTPLNGTDASTKAYVDSVVATGAASAAAAAASAAAALASQNAASTSAGNSAASAATSLTYSNNSSTFATNSSNSATASANSATASQTSRLASETARDKAQEWSDKPEDVFVTGTTEYSAYHWSRKALGYVAGSIANVIHAATAKGSPAGADEIAVADSANGWALAKLTLTSISAYVRSYLTGQPTTWISQQQFQNIAQAAIATYSSTSGSLVTIAKNTPAIGPAVIEFNRPGAFSGMFGLDTDNKWKVGGLSMGLNSYEIVHMGNYTTLLDPRYLQIANVVLGKQFISAQQTIVNAGLNTIAHGLGVKPLLVSVVLVCITAELGYSIGDEVFVTYAMDDTGSSVSRGISIVPDATNLNIRQGNHSAGSWALLNKTSGVSTGITIANWRWVIRAWA